MAAKKIADKKAFEAAKAARAAAAKAAKDARDLAYKQEVEARKKRDAEIAAAHQKKMLEKKKAFEAEFKHVWGSSATGLSIATIDMPDYNSANHLITKLFEKTLIADVQSYATVTRIYKSVIDLSDARSNIVRANVQRVVAITSDDRVAEMVEEIVDVTKDQNIDVLVR